jgi:tetratricopeptide (TPR) repeat protein
LGRAQFDVGSVQDATAAFSKSIQLSDGRFAQPYFGLALVLCQENHFAEADTAAKSGLSLEPDSLIGRLSLSWAELGLGRLESAEKTLREVLQHKTDFRQARLLLVEVHRREHKLPDLIEDIEAYLKIDSTSTTSAQLRQLRDDTLRTLAQSDNKPVAMARTQP